VVAPGVVTITTVAATTGDHSEYHIGLHFGRGGRFECFIPTAKGANSLTATFRKPHPSGAQISWGRP